jgi:two-component system sensor histidine kinase KdpD
MRLREDRTQALYALSRDLSKSSYPDELFKIALRQVEEFFKCRAVVFTPDASRQLVVHFGEPADAGLTASENAVAQWVYEHKKAAGKGTDTLPGSTGIYLPFAGLEKTVGVIGVFSNDDKQFTDPEQLHLLEMFVSQTALAVEGAQLAAAAIDAESQIKNERLRNFVLTNFSYELLEPLTSISQTASELLKLENINDELKRASLIQKMRSEVECLNNFVAELPKLINWED